MMPRGARALLETKPCPSSGYETEELSSRADAVPVPTAPRTTQESIALLADAAPRWPFSPLLCLTGNLNKPCFFPSQLSDSYWFSANNRSSWSLIISTAHAWMNKWVSSSLATMNRSGARSLSSLRRNCLTGTSHVTSTP